MPRMQEKLARNIYNVPEAYILKVSMHAVQEIIDIAHKAGK